jgi:hypothetical protein
MKILLFAVLLCSALAIGRTNAKAEDCKSNGCQGIVGYVFLPLRGFELKGPAIFSLGAHVSCEPEADSDPFGGTRLPVINSIQSIQNATVLFTEQEIQETLDKFRPEYAERTNSGSSCRVIWKQPGPDAEIGDISIGIGLGKGATVRMLGYRTFVGHYSVKGTAQTVTFPQQLLFAMVLVTKDP